MTHKEDVVKTLHESAEKVIISDDYPLVFFGVDKATEEIVAVMNGRPDLIANVLHGLLVRMGVFVDPTSKQPPVDPRLN